MSALELFTAYSAAAMEFDRLSRCEGVDPFTADRQTFVASELMGRALELHKRLEENLDAKAETVRRIRSATP